MTPSIVVIAKAPVPGRVKTRLCPPCTPEEAAQLARAALADTLTAVLATPAANRVLVLDGAPGPWIPEGLVIVPQRGELLDERLTHAFAAITGSALLVGMDTPQLTPDDLDAASRALARPGTDAVLGPATDGGWWIIGLRRPDRRVFAGVPMSTAHTGRAQRDRLRELELGTTLLPELRDVDTYDDAVAVAEQAPNTRFAATLRALSAAAPVAR